MNSIQTTNGLRQALDEYRLENKPLPPHHVSQFDHHVREVYAHMLALVLTAENKITASQSRVFKLILDSLYIETTSAAIFEHASANSATCLREFAATNARGALGESLMMDCLVLFRLEAALSTESMMLLSEVADFLALDSEQVSTISIIAGSILGLHNAPPVPRGLEGHAFRNWSEFLPKAMVRRMPHIEPDIDSDR